MEELMIKNIKYVLNKMFQEGNAGFKVERIDLIEKEEVISGKTELKIFLDYDTKRSNK